MENEAELIRMDNARALEINGYLVLAWMHRNDIDVELPDFDGITLADALEAAGIARTIGEQEHEDGTPIHMSFDQTISVVQSYLYSIYHKKRPEMLADIKPLA